MRSRLSRLLETVAILLLGGAMLLLAAPELEHWLRSGRRGSTRSGEPVPAVSGSEDGIVEPGVLFRLQQQAVDLSALAEYRLATQRLEEARRLAPDDANVRRNLQTVLLNWGTSELLAGHLQEAERLLRRAAELGERAEVLRALGLLLHKRGDFSAATGTLEHALRHLPNDSSVLLALGDAYLRQEKRAQAFDVLQRAQELGVGGSGLQTLLDRLAREIDAEWDFVGMHTPHFQATFADEEEREAVRTVLDGLEDAYIAVGRKLGYYPEAKTPVVLYAQEDFHSATLTPDWAGGAFDGRIKIPVRGLDADDPGLTRSLRHEYAHSVIATLVGPACPVWLNEGLAVWAEEDIEGEREDWAWATRSRLGTYAFADIDRAFASLPGRRVEAAYAQSYLVVRRLVDRYGNQGLRDFLDRLRHSRDPEQSLAELFGDSWTGLLHEVESGG